MNIKLKYSKWAALAGLILTACGAREETSSSPSTFQQKTAALRGSAFGFAQNEIALTLDDGPGPYTKGLARYLEFKKIPATFFVNFKNGDNGIDTSFGRDAMQTLCSSSILDVGNHSDFHNYKMRTWDDIKRVHEFLTNSCHKNWMFFRAPGGNWKSTDADTLNAGTDNNAVPLRTTYIGPVYWDYGGDAPRADWHPDCQKDPNWCRTSYEDEIVVGKTGGIVLAHDIHASTIEMLLGKNWRSLIEDPTSLDANDGLLAVMRNKGYSWVSLSKNTDIVTTLLGRPYSLLALLSTQKR